MEQIKYAYKFLYKIRWWLLITPVIITICVILGTGNLTRSYTVNTTIYTGIVSGYGIESEELGSQNWNILNNTLENIINIITSKETLKDVSIHLYAQHMIYGDPEKDNTYIKAKNYKALLAITPKEVLALIDKKSEEKTVENLKAYEKNNSKNFIYGLFNWVHPHYSYEALHKITVKKLGSSDMLEISYSCDDPGIAYNTLKLLNKAYVNQYKEIQFGTTNNVILYFEEELDKVGKDLRRGEDSLTVYNIENRIINYEEQTKQVAALDKEFELKYQEILLSYNSAKALTNHLEKQMDENVKLLKSNASFITKLNNISGLSTKIAELQSFNKDSTSLSTDARKLNIYKRQLSEAENDLRSFSQEMSAQKYTKDGYATSNFVSQWIEEQLKLEKATSEINVMNDIKSELNKQYSHFSPIGSTIKRKERGIDFMERSYLSILSSLNAARLRLKSLEMNSASLKVLNPPTYPLVSEPTRRKLIIIVSYLASLIFILGCFVIKELFGSTLSDKLRTERITKGKVLGVFPGKEKLRKRHYTKQNKAITTQYLSNALQNYFAQEKPNIINITSINPKSGKSTVSEAIAAYWEEGGVRVKILNWETSFSSQSKDFLFAKSINDICPDANEYDIVIVEYASLTKSSIPLTLLQSANINLVVLDANGTWEERSQILFNNLKTLSGNVPVRICLANVESEVIESFIDLDNTNELQIISK